MKYVVDACNLIFTHTPLEEMLENRGFQSARAMLVRMLSGFAHSENLEEVTAVFDGSEKGAHRPRREREAAGKVVLIYADPRTDADNFIIEMVEDAKSPGEFTVVSNDKFIIRHIQKAGAHPLSCSGFLRKLRASAHHARDPLKGEDPRKYNGLSAREVEEWSKIFGLDSDGNWTKS
jgi:predicted RNA-binding protein with PIN domain